MSSTIDSPPPATNSRFKWIQILEHLFLIAGVLALGFYGSAKLYTSAYQSYEKYSFEQQLSGRTPSIPGFVGHLLGKKEAPEQLATGKRTVNGEELLRSMVYAPEIVPMDKGWSADRLRAFKRAATPSPGSVLGRLEIPSVDLSVMLLQGTDDWTLNRAVGHIEGTALPGQPGNLGVAGHRDGFFRCLKDVTKNTMITVTTLKGRFHYRVSAINIVKPKDVKLLSPTTRPTLTLVTCYPFHYVGDAPKRYIVTAEMVKIQGINDVAAEYAKASAQSSSTP